MLNKLGDCLATNLYTYEYMAQIKPYAQTNIKSVR